MINMRKKTVARILALCLAGLIAFSDGSFNSFASTYGNEHANDITETNSEINSETKTEDAHEAHDVSEDECCHLEIDEDENITPVGVEGDIAGGKYAGVTWRIDSEGNLTGEGTATSRFTVLSQNIDGTYFQIWPWSSYRSAIKTAVIDIDGLTSTREMFKQCKNIISIDLSESDTSNVTDMSEMFSGCESLTELDMVGFDTSKVTDMSKMFYMCKSLTKLHKSVLNTSNVTNMARMFWGCESLSELDVSDFDTSKVTDMSYMFRDCESLNKLYVKNFDTSKVTDMCRVFYGCESLTELDVSNFDTSRVTNMISMFNGCKKLSILDVKNFDTSKVTDMGSMFYECESLSELDVSDFNTSKVTGMGDMFYKCESLKELDVSNFDTSKVTNMSSMFRDCYVLSKLDVSNFDTSKVKGMSEMFSGCKALIELDIVGFDTSKVTNMSHMFYGCESLTELDVSNFDTSKVISTGMILMFNGCKNLKSLDLSNFDLNKFSGGSDFDVTSQIGSSIELLFLPTKRSKEVVFPALIDDFWKNYVDIEKVNDNRLKTDVGLEGAVIGRNSIEDPNLIKVRLNPNGGNFSGCEKDEPYIKCVKKNSKYGSLLKPENGEKCFAGWYTKIDGGDEITKDSVLEKEDYIPVELYAKWSDEHFTVVVDAVESTCTQMGYSGDVYCEICGEFLEKGNSLVINPDNHKLVTDEALAPTCCNDGLTEGKHCELCNKVIEEQTIIKATGHSYGEAELTKEATCASKGEMKQKCTVCGDELSTEIPMSKNHVWDDGTVTKKPTYTEEGELVKTCTICKATDKITIPKIEKKIEKLVVGGKEYSVILEAKDTDGNFLYDVNLDNKVSVKGKKVKLSKAGTMALKGYSFKGWYINVDNKEKKVSSISSKKLTDLMTIKAVFSENTYTITYKASKPSDAKKAKVTGKVNPTKNVKYNDSVELSIGGFTCEGYKLTGWSTSKGAAKPEYQLGEKVKSLSDKKKGKIVLYPVWAK